MFLDTDQKAFNPQSDRSAFASAIKLISLSGKRIIKALLAAAHESKREQAQRIIQQYQHLVDPAAGQQSGVACGPIAHLVEEAARRPVAPHTRRAVEKTDLARMSLRSGASHVSL